MKRNATYFFPVLICGAISIGGCIAVNSSLRDYAKAHDSTFWPNVPGKVIRSEVTHRRMSGHKSSYFSEVVYEYQIRGKLYKNDDISVPRVSHSSRVDAQKTAFRYPEGKRVSVSYRPSDPLDSLLEPGVNSDTRYAIGGSFGLLLFPLLVLCFLIWHQQHSR